MQKKTSWIFSVLVIFSLVAVFISMPAFGKGKTPPPVLKTDISRIKLFAPESPEFQTYLGVEKDSQFFITQLPAKLLLIEVLNAFCPDCQKNAPPMNQVFNIIENDTELKSGVKLIGIAAGNSANEIKPFIKEFKIKFPVFPDPDNKLHELLGNAGPPAVILSDINGNVLFFHEGVVKDMDLLLQNIQEAYKQL